MPLSPQLIDQFRNYINHCNPLIIEILTEIDPEQQLFENKRLSNGFTFLIPYNVDETLQELRDDDDIINTFNYLKRFIITPYLATPSEWNIRRDEIGNLRNRQVQISDIKGRQIILSNNAILELDNKFSGNNKIAIYHVREGEIEEGKTKLRKQTNKKTSSSANSNVKNIRAKLLSEVISQNNNLAIYHKSLELVTSFLKYLSQSNDQLLLQIFPFLDYCPITCFVLLFEPGKTQRFFIDTNIINEWYISDTKVQNPAKFLLSLVSKLSKNVTPSKAYSESQSYNTFMNDIRDDILSDNSIQSMNDQIELMYSSLVNDNSLNDQNNILPEFAFKYLKSRCTSSYNIKLMQDEIRSVISQRADNYRDVLSDIYRTINKYPMTLNRSVIRAQTIGVATVVRCIFISSTYFLYICPATIGQFGGKPCLYTDINPNKSVGDPIAIKMKQLGNIKLKPMNINHTIDDINEIFNQYQSGEIANLPPELLQAMQKALSTNNLST